MKQWIFNSALIAGLAFMSGCGSAEPEVKKEQAGYKKLSNEESLEAEMKAIDENVANADLVANSLNYSKESGAAVLVLAHLSANNEILKIEEKYSDGKGRNTGTIVYYMKEKFPVATVERFEDNVSNPQEPKFVERISYYDAKGKVLGTKEKRVNYEEELPNVDYVSVPAHACTTDRAMRVLEQKGEFETTFQGFAETEVLDYLIVGQPGDDAYTSTMRVEMEDDFIKEALRDQVKNLNRKCRVSFQVATASSGFEYQVYTGGEWVD